jgi:hypothetical protein
MVFWENFQYRHLNIETKYQNKFFNNVHQKEVDAVKQLKNLINN